MSLTKDDKIKLLQIKSIFDLPENKREIGDKDGIDSVSVEIHHTLHDLETEPDDKVIREIADKLFNLLKNYPDIMKELKERYFKTI